MLTNYETHPARQWAVYNPNAASPSGAPFIYGAALNHYPHSGDVGAYAIAEDGTGSARTYAAAKHVPGDLGMIDGARRTGTDVPRALPPAIAAVRANALGRKARGAATRVGSSGGEGAMTRFDRRRIRHLHALVLNGPLWDGAVPSKSGATASSTRGSRLRRRAWRGRVHRCDHAGRDTWKAEHPDLDGEPEHDRRRPTLTA